MKSPAMKNPVPYRHFVRWTDLELEYGIEKSKVDAIRSKLFGALRTFYQERDRLRVLVNFRKAFIGSPRRSTKPATVGISHCWNSLRKTSRLSS